MAQSTDIKEGALSSDTKTNINNNFTELYNGLFNGIAPVNVTASTVTLAQGTHSGRVTTLNRAAGVAVTLPAATGTGNTYTIEIGTTITSNTTTVTCAGSDKYEGLAWVFSDDAGNAVKAFDSGGTTSVITLDGTTKGGYVGHLITLRDVASAKWHVTSMGKATGVEVTPFS